MFKLITAHEFPSVGDGSKVYSVTLTEPEINTIHAVFGFLQGMIDTGLAPAITRDWWNHYRPTLLHLSERLQEFDD
jgi:hypothetical protein